MLSQLHIENIAVIREADVHFETGLNILTGETGAGKSIIIDSINMILGERTSRDLIRAGEEKALVEALFYVEQDVIEDIFVQFGIEADEERALLISREITTAGRNVCRINGRIVTSSMLKDIGKLIINIHGQHDNQALLQNEKHAEFLDKYAYHDIMQVKNDYRKVYETVSDIKSEMKKLGGDERERERKIDLLQFQLEEINGADLKSGEEEELTEQKLFLGNAEKVTNGINDAYDRLYTGSKNGTSIYDNMTEVLRELGDIERFDSKLKEFCQAIQDVEYQLEEVVRDIRSYREQLEFDPGALENIEQRLDIIYRLKRKYGSNINEILKYRDEIQSELDEINHSDEKLKALEHQLEKEQKRLTELGILLSDQRCQAARQLEQKIISELKDLDMEKVQFKVQVEEMYDKSGQLQFTYHGCDKIEFLISTNPGEGLKPLAKIASGGEMSRIMLAIKTVLADSDEVNTLIFDEIDIGVSGRAAQKIAEKLSLISQKKQVLCITHLSQIASMADHHYLIEKYVDANKTSTTVKKLNAQNRKKELARMIGGAIITDLTMKHAEEMIDMAYEIKNAQ